MIIRYLFVFLLLASHSADCAPLSEMERRFTARIYRSEIGELPYRILISASGSRPLPLVLFLHGSGERGTDNIRHMHVGLNILADAATLKKFPCVIVAPQCPPDMRWVDADWKADAHVMKDDPAPPLAMAIGLVRSLSSEQPVDESRLYVVGYSMGGFGAWESIQRWPGLFAAAVPVCGGGDTTMAFRAAGTPVWAFHGSKDTIVNVSQSRTMIQAVVAAGGVPRYTEYPELGHGVWGIAFSDDDMLAWLFRQRLCRPKD